MRMAVQERRELIHLLGTFSSEKWDAPTLCSQWSVRDVFAHVFSFDKLSYPQLVARFLRGGLGPARINAIGVAAAASRNTDQLIAAAQDNLQPDGLMAWFGGRIALTDALIHQQDIRRPLGLTRKIPAERLVAALEFAKISPALKAKKLIRGLTLTAVDLDWTTGRGPDVNGPAESLLMVMSGRGNVISELSGPGLPKLAGCLSRKRPVARARPGNHHVGFSNTGPVATS